MREGRLEREEKEENSIRYTLGAGERGRESLIGAINETSWAGCLGFSCEHSSPMSIFLVHYCFETLSLLPSILSLSPCRPPPPPHVNFVRYAERPLPSARARGKRLLLLSAPPPPPGSLRVEDMMSAIERQQSLLYTGASSAYC